MQTKIGSSKLTVCAISLLMIVSCDRERTHSKSDLSDIPLYDAQRDVQYVACFDSSAIKMKQCAVGTPPQDALCKSDKCNYWYAMDKTRFLQLSDYPDTGPYLKTSESVSALHQAITMEEDPTRKSRLETWLVNLEDFLSLWKRLNPDIASAPVTSEDPEFKIIMQPMEDHKRKVDSLQNVDERLAFCGSDCLKVVGCTDLDPECALSNGVVPIKDICSLKSQNFPGQTAEEKTFTCVKSWVGCYLVCGLGDKAFP